MERGVYFDGWYRGRHCYHPSLPSRRLSMVEDLERYSATVLVWSALGGGSVSLPYLEDEAHGRVALRDRMYGVVNDSEFIAECGRRGIRVFGVVFEAQGWEFPVELDEDEAEVLSLNELRGVGRRGWLGLREFGADRYPRIWPAFSSYFPDGLRNSRGEMVTDLIEECCSRRLDGSPHHARWVECPGMDHQCFYMDRNNPVWREYLKAVIRIQIDAGVHGVQLDEASTPLNALQYGGCFCRDCMTGFRDHLQGLPSGDRPVELGERPLATFDYGEMLRELGVDPAVAGAATPMIGHYFTYQRTAVTRTFVELADYARDYAASLGRSVEVTGNLYNVFPYYNGIIEHVDLVVTEMRNVAYRQPEWFRYVVGMARGKQVVVVENPYGGVIPELLARLDQGEGYDLARLMAYEAAAMGANLTLPYGSWMGSEIRDAFSLPDGLAVEIQSFLASIDASLSTTSANDVAVLFDVGSNALLSLERHIFSDNRVNDVDEAVAVPFWDVTEQLGRSGVPFDVVAVNDDIVPAWRMSARDLARYRLVVLPGAPLLPDWAEAELERYRAAGGTVVSVDDPGQPAGQSSPGAALDPVLALARGLTRVEVVDERDVGVNTHALDGGAVAIHLVNYRLDRERGTVLPVGPVTVRLRDWPAGTLRLVRPDGPPVDLHGTPGADGGWTFEVAELGSYGVLTATG
jgi:hypothetical protein